ncbi:hypothetical protein [Halobacillus amylolyticus]|uniref:Uncharacterized protein n=1 Tax=Halobacillus amylolyticus TaxID=2932259 RepID=A0ABY4H9F8_9BACI|nr:hypothetical protein [Halobacillus amylolyticus]UOR11500.1 hypothetical protein MUO15_18205 [Halobacillus amylolyticus]
MMETKIYWGVYWIFVVSGFLSFSSIFFQEYGIITTVILTFLCSLFSWAFAMMLGKSKLIYISVLLLIGPYLLLLSRYFI